jgi:hypothetical protein
MPYPEQCTAAQNIMAVFLAATLRFAMLIARCQAGKTGAYLELIRIMLANGSIRRAYILCGSNDTDLRDQAHKDAKKALPEAYADGITILFRQDFKTRMDITNSLIVVDESHMDQTQKQELDVFLAEHGLTMDGNPRTLVEKNAFIVSVDATPYSELAALMHKESFPKHVEQLAPGEGYFGLADYFHKGFVRPTYPINSAFAEMVRSGGKKYGLMRLTAGKHADEQEAAAIAVYTSLGGEVKYHTAEREEIRVADLGTAPRVPTLVIVRGRLRAGKVVEKQHIAFVWEGARVSKTDALVQGLLGRMCGYDVPQDDQGMPRIILFAPQSSLKRHEGKVVKASEIERAIMEYPLALPTQATNIKKGHIANRPTNGKTQCPPLRLELDDSYFDERGNWHTVPDGEDCRRLLIRSKRAIHSAPFSNKQKLEILSFIGAATPYTRTLAQGISEPFKKYFGSIIQSHATKTACAEHVAEFPQMTFFVTRDAIVPNANKRHVYVVFYTDATNGVSPSLLAVDLKSRIPVTNGKSVFSIHDAHVDRPLVAGGVVGFDESRIKTPETLRSSLHDYMALWRDSGFTVARCIQSNKDRFTLQKGAFQYLSPKNNMVEVICRSLSTEFGVKVKVTYTRSGDSTFNVKKISW